MCRLSAYVVCMFCFGMGFDFCFLFDTIILKVHMVEFSLGVFMYKLKFNKQVTIESLVVLLETQSPTMFEGDDYNGISRSMSSFDVERRDILVSKLNGLSGSRSVVLEKRDLAYLYAVTAERFSKVYDCKYSNVYGVPDESNPRWRSYCKAFKKAGLSNYDYRSAWSN